METVRLQKLADLPVPSDGYLIVANSVADDESLLFLSIEQDGTEAVTETYSSGIGIFPKTRMQSAKRFRLSISKDGNLRSIELPELDVTFPLADIFPDGKILVVGPRCSWRSEKDYDLNGIIIDPETGHMSRILLGDGINKVYVDAIGRIWVAYGDEGIFGNFGWGGPGPTPIGAAGLVCFSEAGKKIWEYPSHASEMMADCYALNASGSEAAIYFYSDFPVCRISRDFKLRFWKTELRGCKEFALSESQVLFSCQYNDSPDTAYLSRFEADGQVSTHQVRLLLPDVSIFPQGHFLGRGKHLYFFGNGGVYRASLD